MSTIPIKYPPGYTYRKEGSGYRVYDAKGNKTASVCVAGARYPKPNVFFRTGFVPVLCPGQESKSLWGSIKEGATNLAKIAVAPITVPLQLSARVAKDTASSFASGMKSGSKQAPALPPAPQGGGTTAARYAPEQQQTAAASSRKTYLILGGIAAATVAGVILLKRRA